MVISLFVLLYIIRTRCYKISIPLHSHASLLVEMGFTPLAISERLGHEKIETTLNTYSHLYPNKQGELADRLEMENNREDEE